MIRVFYRPLYKLRYLHIALLALLKVPASVTELSEKLRVQQIIIDHALDDILSWSLACSNVGTIELTDRGRRCGVVWLMTDKRGFWEFEDSSGWPLGDGVFSFRKPLRSLEDAGLNSETGEVLSKDIA